jgi:hypothetical protein
LNPCKNHKRGFCSWRATLVISGFLHPVRGYGHTRGRVELEQPYEIPLSITHRCEFADLRGYTFEQFFLGGTSMNFIRAAQHAGKQLLGVATVSVALGAATPAHALYINLSSTGNASADSGFRAAANFWQNLLTDNVTVNIKTGFASLGAGVLGQAGSSYYSTSFSNMKAALNGDMTSADDATMVAGLAGGSSYSKLINGTVEGSKASHLLTGITSLEMTRANAKALGLLAGNNAAEDAQITFSNNFGFDFDGSNGIAAGLFDFVGIAIHEIGHALGFTSGVDVLDYNYNSNFQYHDYQYNPFATVLDFTRCSAASEAAGADMDWTIGNRPKSFAINGSCSGSALVNNAWSTGETWGDGRQASHWKDDLGRGIMDPTMAPGEIGVVSPLDLLAFDVIGWDLKRVSTVPEPSSLLLMGSSLMAFFALRRRRKLA